MSTIIYHNPRCSKSRKTLELLTNNKINSIIIEYLKQAIDPKQIKMILSLTQLSIREIMRQKEEYYISNNLNNPDLSEDDLINIIIQHPILLERPIVIHNNKAKVCRPPELVLELINS